MKSKFIPILIIFILFNVFNHNTLSAASEYNNTAAQTQVDVNNNIDNNSIVFNLGRGFSNLLLCWFEVPKQIIYQGSQVPVFGLVSGLIYGSATTVWRALSGVTDILSLGFGGGNIYFAQGMTQFPWQGPWVRSKIPNRN